MRIRYERCNPETWQVELVIYQVRVRMTARDAAGLLGPETSAPRQKADEMRRQRQG